MIHYLLSCALLGGLVTLSVAAEEPAPSACPHAQTSPSTPPELPASNAVSSEASAKLYERFKKLAGEWHGRSTQGWAERCSYRVIARDSVVMHTSNFEAHPGETMVTMFHLDGGRLMLTHYCVARNQPRLVATEVADDGATVTFTFLDGTNLASRERGHMDKCVYRFVDDDHLSTRWTWYQDGKEKWMEEITLERVAAPSATGAKPAGEPAGGP